MIFEAGTYRIEELISAGLLEIGDGYRAKNSELADHGIPFARAGNINDGFKFESADLFPADALTKVGNKVSRPGDVVFTSKGTVGRFGMVSQETQQFVYSPQLCFWRSLAPNLLLPEYLYYWMNSAEFFNQIGYLKGQTDMADYVSLRDQRRITATIPDTASQRLIVDAVKPLDDRITLLRETNATLEALAQALFKSWFVDFDPVRAKQEGREPEGMDEATAALFPDSFEESELGLVPRGWRVCSFTDTIDVIGGGTPKTSVDEYWNGNIPWFSVVDAPTLSDVFVIDTEKHITQAGINNSSTRLLTAGTTIISARGTVGRLALIGRDMAMNQSCYGLRGKTGDDYFTYFNTYRIVETLKQRTHGSVFDTITRNTLSGVTVIYPSGCVIGAFEDLLSPVMGRIKANQHQAQTLAALRDTLLPRLISGQLRLPEAEAILEEVVA